ncbi:DUF3592 domain-containing protein [Caldimonas brevitalea]|uniref:DUF3592 domain-containing protein n=1 Tax=Caldimonas brevitalea TaxID=413882 RepID=A0A0G3BNF3_9BURK|nr:DUF3592 domain-containing protein [Caldimonas brevitalea]AKJ28881.1 hypothetical protein AAW51_2190 [Caldimonas brevitalea]
MSVWWGFGIAFVVLMLVVVVVARDQHRVEKLRREGIAARATVLQARQTGTWVNKNPEIEFRLGVEKPGQPPYEVTLKKTVPVLNLTSVQVGSVLQVRVDRENPQRLAFDEPWAR